MYSIRLKGIKTVIPLVILAAVLIFACNPKQKETEQTGVEQTKTDTIWYQQPMRIAALQCNFESDNLAIIDKWADMGVNVEQLFHPMGDSYSAIYQPEKHREILKAYIKKAHENGIKIILYLNVHILGPTLADNAEIWSQRKADGSINYLYGTYPSICMNGPWKDYFFGILDSLKEMDVDGLFLDGPSYCRGGCKCEYCNKLHREHFGETLDDPEKVWDFNAWTRENFLQGAYDYWKKDNPEKIFYMNLPILHSSVLYTNVKKALNYNDILGTEGGFMFYEPAKNGFLWKTSYTARMIEAVAPDKPRVIFMAADHKPWSWWLHTALETKLCIASTSANAANIWYGFHGSSKLFNNDGAKAAKEMFHFLKKNEDVLGGTKSTAEVAMLYSFVNDKYCVSSRDETDFTGKQEEEIERPDSESSIRGYYSLLMESQIPFDMVTDLNLDVLSKYKVLVVPVMWAMDKKTENAIREFVKNGGTLITELGTSLNDEKGNRKEDFGLTDVLGISLAGEYKKHENFNYFKLDSTSNYNEIINFPLIPLPLLSVEVKATAGASVHARAIEDLPGRYVPLPGTVADYFVSNKYNMGESYYFAGSMGAMYYDYHVKEYKTLIASIIKDKLGDYIQFENAPTNLEVVLRK